MLLHAVGEFGMRLEHRLKFRTYYVVVTHDMFAVHDRVARRDRPASQPRLNRVGYRPSKGWAGQRPNRHIANTANRQFADLADTSKTTSATTSCTLERHSSRAGASAAAQLCEQHRLTRLEPHRCTISRRRAVNADANVHASSN